MAIATGVMAKACESLDHLEKYDYRQALEAQVIEISTVALIAFSTMNIDFSERTRARWAALERKSIFGESNLRDESSPAITLVKAAEAKTAGMSVHRDRDSTEEWVLDPGRKLIKTLLGHDFAKVDPETFRLEISRCKRHNETC